MARRSPAGGTHTRHQPGDRRSRAGEHRPGAARRLARPDPAGAHAKPRRVSDPAPEGPDDQAGERRGGDPPRAARKGRESLRDPGGGHGRDLGHRVELRHVHRHPTDDRRPRDTRLRSPPSDALSQRALRRAHHPRSGPRPGRQPQRLVGRRDGPAAVHAVELPPARHRLRRRRPYRHLDDRSRRVRFDGELPARRGLGQGRTLGPRGAESPAPPWRRSTRASPCGPAAAAPVAR